MIMLWIHLDRQHVKQATLTHTLTTAADLIAENAVTLNSSVIGKN
jgi:hypothetical protein